jgi:hypothetical protein
MKRRKFVLLSGSVSVGLASNINKNVKGLDISVDMSENNIQIDIGEIDSLILLFEEGEIVSANLDDSKNANLSIEATINGRDVGEIKSLSINIDNSKSVSIDPIGIDIANAQNYQSSLFDKEINKVDLIFSLSHPDTEDVVHEEPIKVQLTAGALDDQDFSNYSTVELKSETDVIDISGGPDMDVWTENMDRITQLDILMSTSSFINESSYTSPKGGIDDEDNKFELSPRDPKLEKNLQNPEIGVSNVSGGPDMDVWTENMDRITQLDILMSTSSFINESSYTSPKGGIDDEDNEFELSPRDPKLEKNLQNPETKYVD